MKKAIMMLFILAMVNVVGAMNLELAWNPSCEPFVMGYHLYYDTISITNPPVTFTAGYDSCTGEPYPLATYWNSFPQYLELNGINNTNATIYNVIGGATYVFTVTSFYVDTNLNELIESPTSSQIYLTIPQLTYTNGGTPPTLNMNEVLVYLTNWYNPPRICTNHITHEVYTNYYSTWPYVYNLRDDRLILTNWTVLANSNLLTPNWTVFAQGSNSMVAVPVTNTGGNLFFRLKIGN